MLRRLQSNGNSHRPQSLTRLTYKPAILLLGTEPTSTKLVFTKESLYVNVYSDSIHNHQNWEKSPNVSLLVHDSARYIHPAEPCLARKSNKRLTTGMNFKCITRSEGSQTQSLYSVWFRLCDMLEKADYGDKKEIAGCQGTEVRRGTDHSAAGGNFVGSGIIFSSLILW